MIVDDPWEFLYVPVQKYLYLLQRPTDSLKCDMLSFLLLQSSAWYTLRQARKPLYKLRKYTSDSTHIGTCCTYSYASWCYTQWEINSPLAKQKYPWLYFCYVLQSSPRSLFLRGAANKLISSRSRFWFLVRAHQWLPSLSNLYSQTKLLARPAVRHGRRARAKKISGPKWPSSSLGKICFCCEPCSCIFEI